MSDGTKDVNFMVVEKLAEDTTYWWTSQGLSHALKIKTHQVQKVLKWMVSEGLAEYLELQEPWYRITEEGKSQVEEYLRQE